MKKIILILLLVLPDCCFSSVTWTETQAEIAHLFSFLENSGCQFNRNGSWHTAKEATTHLFEKYQSVTKKEGFTNTESFIETVASKSSMTGTPYQVKCSNATPVESGAWFRAELNKYRKTNAVVK